MDYPPFARVSSRDFFIDIWPIVIESDNITMKLSFDEFFLVQKMIPFFSFEKYLNITRVHVHCENSCVLFLLRCIGRSITGIFFFFLFFEATPNIQPVLRASIENTRLSLWN